MTPPVYLTADRLIGVPCTPHDSAIVKQIPGRVWVGTGGGNHQWLLPATQEALDTLRARLPGLEIPAEVTDYIASKAGWRERVEQARAEGDHWTEGLIDATPYNHQRQALAFMRVVLEKSRATGPAHDMGLGKTITLLQMFGEMDAAQYKRVGRHLTALVVCPVSVIGVWVREAAKFCQYPIRVVPLTGETVAKRAARVLATEAMPFDGATVYVTNYEVTWRPALLKALVNTRLDVVACDEAHRLKNHGSAQSKAVRQISRNSIKVAATGTPVDTLQDWYGLYRWLDPSVFGASFEAFRNLYFDTRPLDSGIEIIVRVKPEMQAQLLERAHSILHVQKKEDALDLPDKVFVDRYCELEPKARKIYNQMRDEAISELEDGRAVIGQNALTRMLRLTQITGGFLRHDDSVIPVSTAKLGLLHETLTDLLEREDKVVVVAHKTPEIDAIRTLLRGKGFWMREEEGKPLGVIDGRVSQAQREQYIEDFQEGDMRVIIVQEKAGGAGITLHASACMVRYSGGRSSIDYRQVLDRIHRIGQTRVCTYVNLLCDDTVDEVALQHVRDKTNLAQLTVEQARELF